MKVLIILLTMTSLTFGQARGQECLDIDSKFALFTPQFKNTTKSKAITDLGKCPRDTIYIRLNFSRNVRYDHDIKGIAIELINTTDKDLIVSNAFQDFFCQVKNKNEWFTIEKNDKKLFQDDVPLDLVIPPNNYATVIMPCYNGTEIVTMRYRFVMGHRVMLTQEFQGSINPKLLR